MTTVNQWWAAEEARIAKAEAQAAILAVAPARSPAPTTVSAAETWRRAVDTKPVAGGPAVPTPFHAPAPGGVSQLAAWQRAIAKQAT